MSDANKAIVRRHYEEGVNKGDVSVATEAFAPEYVNYVPGGLGPQHGIAAWVEFFQSFRAAFPDMHTTLEHVFSEGELVAVRHVWHATHEGEYAGIPATGRQVTFTGNDIYRVVDGKIVEEWSEFDEFGLLQQLEAARADGAAVGP